MRLGDARRRTLRRAGAGRGGGTGFAVRVTLLWLVRPVLTQLLLAAESAAAWARAAGAAEVAATTRGAGGGGGGNGGGSGGGGSDAATFARADAGLRRGGGCRGSDRGVSAGQRSRSFVTLPPPPGDARVWLLCCVLRLAGPTDLGLSGVYRYCGLRCWAGPTERGCMVRVPFFGPLVVLLASLGPPAAVCSFPEPAPPRCSSDCTSRWRKPEVRRMLSTHATSTVSPAAVARVTRQQTP